MSDALDLDVIETAAYGHGFVSALDVIALVAEVRRLRAEVEAAEVRGARWALDRSADLCVHSVGAESPPDAYDAARRLAYLVRALDPAEVCRARRGR